MVIECGDNARNSIASTGKIRYLIALRANLMYTRQLRERLSLHEISKFKESAFSWYLQLQCPIQSVKKKRKLPVDRKNMKIDDWLVKVRVVDEKTRLKR